MVVQWVEAALGPYAAGAHGSSPGCSVLYILFPANVLTTLRIQRVQVTK